MLPYFKRTETCHNSKADPNLHGFDGPIHTTGGEREYPLRKIVHQMWSKAGVKFNADANSGNPFGFAEYTENWHKGARQPAGQAYNLQGVHVVTNALARKVEVGDTSSGKSAQAVELVDGRRFLAKKEVIICCGVS